MCIYLALCCSSRHTPSSGLCPRPLRLSPGPFQLPPLQASPSLHPLQSALSTGPVGPPLSEIATSFTGTVQSVRIATPPSVLSRCSSCGGGSGIHGLGCEKYYSYKGNVELVECIHLFGKLTQLAVRSLDAG